MTARPDVARFLAALQRREPVAVADADPILAAIQAGDSVDGLLGICDPRHTMIRADVGKFYAGTRIDPTAHDFHSDWSRYATSAWCREKHLVDCPHPPGTLRALFWRLLKHKDRVLGVRQIRRILSSRNGHYATVSQMKPRPHVTEE